MGSSCSCAHCGRPLPDPPLSESKQGFCSLGCALVGRVPVDREGQYPVNRAVVAALFLGLLAFNQLLFSSLSVVLAHRDRLALSTRCYWLSAGAAAVLWLSVVSLEIRMRTFRRPEGILAILTLSLTAWWMGQKGAPSPWFLLGINALLLLGSTRGLIKRCL